MAQRWIRDPFLFNLDSMDDNDMMKDDLVELQTNDRIPMEFEKMQLAMFWCAQFKTFPQLAGRALEVLVPFSTTYAREVFQRSYTSRQKPETVWMQVMTCVWNFQRKNLV